MKKTILAALAIAGFAVTTGANAQQISYTPGDALLMFRATTGTGNDKNLYINLGNLSTNGFTSFNLDFSATNSILAQTFGSDWNRDSLYWGVIGGANSAPNLIVGESGAARTDLIADNLWTITTAVDQAFYAGIGALATLGTVTDNNGNAHGYSIFSSGASGSIDYQDERGWSFFTPTEIVNLDHAKNLYFYGVDGDYNVLAPVNTGTVSLAGGSVSVVPEPSTYAMIGFGILLLVVASRRRANS